MQLLKTRTLVFSICVLDGYINAYFVRCDDALTVSLSSDGLAKVVEWVINAAENDRADELLFDELISMLSQVSRQDL